MFLFFFLFFSYVITAVCLNVCGPTPLLHPPTTITTLAILIHRAEGSNILLDPYLMCKKTRRLRGKMAEICRHDSALLKEIINGINLGFRECEFQFRNRRWNCTTLRKSMKKILMRGKFHFLLIHTYTHSYIYL